MKKTATTASAPPAKSLRGRRFTPRSFRWLMTLYPPYWFMGIRPVQVAPDFSSVKVRVRKTWLNFNLNGGIFGGTLAAAVDPWHALLLWQLLTQKGWHLRVASANLRVEFLLNVRSRLMLDFSVSSGELEQVEQGLKTNGKHQQEFYTEGHMPTGELALRAWVTVHLRDLAKLRNEQRPVTESLSV